MTEIDITPTWEGLLMPLLAIYESGDRAYALKELRRMARAADTAVATGPLLTDIAEMWEDAVHDERSQSLKTRLDKIMESQS